jgi:conjugal transfer/entry exclusion protein
MDIVKPVEFYILHQLQNVLNTVMNLQGARGSVVG